MSITGATLTGLLMLAEQSGSTVSSENIGPKYHRRNYESRCGDAVFQVRFQNGPGARSRVQHVLVDGGPVPGAAKTLDRFAARRAIDRIEVMHCGRDPQRPFFRGIMVLIKPESQTFSRENTLFFRLVREGKIWQISVD